MAGYRIFFYGSDGRIKHALEIECETDADAIALVEKHPDGRAKELWQESRRVRVFPAAPIPDR